MRKWQRELLAFASEIGVESPAIAFGGKHPSIVGSVSGKQFRRAIAGSPSDGKRGIQKAKSDIRRAAKELRETG